MPRAPRIEYAGAVYHVMCRGDRRERIIREDEDARLFLHTLEEACARTGWQVQAYVLMPNHYHRGIGVRSHFAPITFQDECPSALALRQEPAASQAPDKRFFARSACVGSAGARPLRVPTA